MNKKISIISSAVVMLFALIFLVYSLKYSFTSDLGPGPATLPFWLSFILLVLSITYLITAIRGKDIVEKMPDRKGQINILFIIMCMIIYVLLLKYLGSVLTGALFLFFLLRKGYKWYAAALIGLIASILLFLLFSVLLEVHLPVNMFGF